MIKIGIFHPREKNYDHPDLSYNSRMTCLGDRFNPKESSIHVSIKFKETYVFDSHGIVDKPMALRKMARAK